MNAELPSARDSQSKSLRWYERRKTREPIPLVGFVVIAPLILPIGFVRFGKTISWGER